VKLPPIHFNLDLEVYSQLNGLGATDLIEVKEEDQVKPRGLILDPLENI
jgi:hypothetical protein